MHDQEKRKGADELTFHLQRLLDSTEADEASKILATKAIIKAMRDSSFGILDDSRKQQLFSAYQSTKDQGLKREIAEILATRWTSDTQLIDFISTEMDSENAHPFVIQGFFHGIFSRLIESPSLSENMHLRRLVAESYKMIDTSGKTLPNYGGLLLQRMLCAMHSCKIRGPERMSKELVTNSLYLSLERDAMTDEECQEYIDDLLDTNDWYEWIRRLEQAFQNSGEAHAERCIAELLSMLEGVPSDEVMHALLLVKPPRHTDETLDEYRGQHPLSVLMPKRNPTLDENETEAFAHEIQRQAYTPESLLVELLREKPYLFLAFDYDSTAEEKLPSLIEILEKEAHLSHLGLHIPCDMKDQFQRFIDGENPVELMRYLGQKPTSDSLFDEYIERTREILQRIDAIGGMEFVLIGPPQTMIQEGELALDSSAGGIVNTKKNDRSAKILVTDFMAGHMNPLTKCTLINSDGNSPIISLPQRLIDMHGICTDQISCVSVLMQHRMLNNSLSFEESDVEELCQRYGIITSFGIRIPGTPLEDKQFDIDYRTTYQDAYDALIVVIPNDDEGGGRHRENPEPANGMAIDARNAVLV